MGSITTSIAYNSKTYELHTTQKHILLPQKKNMSSYSIYIQIKSTLQLICLISYLLVNAEVDKTTP